MAANRIIRGINHPRFSGSSRKLDPLPPPKDGAVAAAAVVVVVTGAAVVTISVKMTLTTAVSWRPLSFLAIRFIENESPTWCVVVLKFTLL